MNSFRNGVAAAAGLEIVPGPSLEEGMDETEAAPEHGPEVVGAATLAPDFVAPVTVVEESPAPAMGESEIAASEAVIPASEAEIPEGQAEIPAGHPEIPPGHVEIPDADVMETEILPGQDEIPHGHDEIPPGQPEIPPGQPEIPPGQLEIPTSGESKVPVKVTFKEDVPEEGRILSFSKALALHGMHIPHLFFVLVVCAHKNGLDEVRSVRRSLPSCGP